MIPFSRQRLCVATVVMSVAEPPRGTASPRRTRTDVGFLIGASVHRYLTRTEVYKPHLRSDRRFWASGRFFDLYEHTHTLHTHL